MKFAWIRYVSLLLVLCICICLMCCFVFATDVGLSPFYFSGSLEPFTDDGLTVYVFLQMLSESDLSLLDSFFGDSIYVSIPAFGVDGFFNVESDSGGVFVEIDDSLFLGVFFDSGNYYFTVSSSVFSGPFSGYMFSEKLPDSPSDLLSDLRLTGTSFLETVQGIVLTIGMNPLLLLTVGIFFVGGCIAIFSRLLSKN